MPFRTPILRTREQERPTYHPVRGQEEDLAGRKSADFICPRGHEFTRVFADDIELPAEWECRQHSVTAERKNQAYQQPLPVKVRTHWDMVRERRKESELARILDDQLTALRAGELVTVGVWLRERGGAAADGRNLP